MAVNLIQFEAVVELLRRILPGDHPADAILSGYFREHRKLGARDRGQIAETVFMTLRRLAFLSHIAGGKPRRLAVAALIKLRGISPKELADFLTEEESRWAQTVKGIQNELDLADRAELPHWAVEMLQAAGQSEEAILALGQGMQKAAPLDIRVNTLKGKRDDVLAQLLEEGFEGSATPYSPFGIRLIGKPAINRHTLFEKGVIEVQDEGSQILGMLLAPRRGEMVVDFCAGAGGKTLLLGALMQSSGRLYAFDVSEKRLANFKPRMARSGLSNVNSQRIEHERDTRIKRLAKKIDRVLVDAPCSGLGTLRRNPDLKIRQTAEALEELNRLQANILASAATLVKAGGRLVYATCSILPAENEAIVEAFLAAHPAFELVPVNSILAEQRIDLEMDGDYLKLMPHAHGTDGFFAAVLRHRKD